MFHVRVGPYHVVKKIAWQCFIGMGSKQAKDFKFPWFQLNRTPADCYFLFGLIDPQQFSTLDAATLTELTGCHRIIVTLEDGQLEGGWGDKVTAFYANAGLRDMRVLNFGAAKEFTDRVPLDALNERYGMTVGNITARIRSESRG